MRTTTLLLLLAASMHFAACKIAGPDAGDAELDDLEQQILDMVGEAPARSATACRAVAFGSKPCGGPWRWLVYSADFTDEAELLELVASYNDLQDTINRDRGLASDCMIVERPTVVYRDGLCSASPES